MSIFNIKCANCLKMQYSNAFKTKLDEWPSITAILLANTFYGIKCMCYVIWNNKSYSLTRKL